MAVIMTLFEKQLFFHDHYVLYVIQSGVDPFTFASIMGDNEDESYLQQCYQNTKNFFATKQSNCNHLRKTERR